MKVPLRISALVILSMSLLLNACTPVAPSAIPTLLPSTPSATPTLPRPTVTLPPTTTPTLMPTLTSMPIPTVDSIITRDVVTEGFADVQARIGDAVLLCARYEDTDADGQPEWLVVVHQDVVPARLSAFVFDGDAVYELEPAPPKPGVPDVGLGQYLTCEVEVRDVNADGLPEIAVFGHAEDNETLLHLFVWDDSGYYRRLGFFSGDAGVRFVNVDGDLEEEILEGYRERRSPSLVWYVVYTWEDQTYGWTSDRYGWYFLNRPHAYPVQRPEYAVVSFYLALNDHDLPGAYDLLLAQGNRAYETWALGFATTVQVSVGNVHVIPGTETENRARVAAMVTSWDNEGGVILVRLWNTEWSTVRTADGWRLVDATAEMLTESPATHWP